MLQSCHVEKGKKFVENERKKSLKITNGTIHTYTRKRERPNSFLKVIMFLKPNLELRLNQKISKLKWSIKRNSRGKMVEYKNHVHKMIDCWEGRPAVKLKRN